jgi:hypothetical protein
MPIRTTGAVLARSLATLPATAQDSVSVAVPQIQPEDLP